MMRLVKNENFLQLDETKIKNPFLLFPSFVEQVDQRKKKKEGVLKGCFLFSFRPFLLVSHNRLF